MIARCGCGWSSDQPNPDSARFAEVTHRQSCMGPGRRARLADLHVRLDSQLAALVDAVEAREWVTAGELARLTQVTVAELRVVALDTSGVSAA